MGKIAFIFPGQGSQYIGMGKELYDHFDEVKKTFQKANNILEQDITSLCFEGPKEELIMTENTQPAILILSFAISQLLLSNGIQPVMAAGLSLGEYSALAVSKAIDFKDILPLVRKRGQFMQEALPLGEGGMAAIIGLNDNQVEECCRIASQFGIVEPANYNCPGQIVISGQTSAVEKACDIAKELGAKRTIILSVSAPFHSSLLKPAGFALSKELDKLMVKFPGVPVVSNVTARPFEDEQQLRALLIKQVSNPVRWESSIRYMIDQGIDTFIEIGPGKVLTGFVKKISKDVKALHIEDVLSYEETIKELEEVKWV